MDAVLYKPFTLAALGQCLAQINPAFASGAQAMDGLPHSEQAMAASETDLLDSAMLVQLEQLTAQGRSEFVQRVCALYLEHAPKCGEDIDRALAQNDLENVRRAAHALKSMSNNIGANLLGQLCADVESATLEEQQDTQLRAKCRSLATTLQATLVALQEYLNSRSANEERLLVLLPVSVPSLYLEPHYRLIEQEIAEGIRRSEFELAYQPLVDPTGQHTLGVEALVRWNRAPRNPMSPDRFIPIAEKTGQIVELGQWILAKACDDAKAWPEITIAVNVSTVQLQRQDFAPSVEALLQVTGFDPTRLELEITETAWSKNEEGLMRTLTRLQHLGVGFSLDDFGSGYSSLTYLRRFPVNKIKIDRAFITDIHLQPDFSTIVEAIVSIGRALGKKIVAEGVETEAEHQFLAAAGVHALQGYLFARPMSAAQLTEWLRQETQMRRYAS